MKKQLLIWLVILLTAVSLLALGGCGPKSAANSDNLKNGELILAVSMEPDTLLDPTLGWGRYGSPLFQSTLLTRDSDLNIVNDLATSYEVSQDGLVWTVKLRDGVKFSDGQLLTAKDVAYTFITAANSGSVVDLNGMRSVEAVDPLTVKFTLKHPQSTFVVQLIALGIVPQHAHDKNYGEHPIGSGPFKFVQWDKGQQLMVEANPYYYGAKPAFKKVTFLFLSDDAAFAAARAGKVDMAYIPATFARQKVAGMRLVALKSVDNRGIYFPSEKPGKKTKGGYPIGNAVTSDIAIRKAINIAIDRQALVDGILEGQGTLAYSVCDGLPWWNPDNVIKDNDIDGAKQILAAAGWKDSDGDGVLEKGALKAEFTLYYPADDAVRQSLSIASADRLKQIGIKVNIKGGSWDEIKPFMYANPVMMGWGSHDPLEMYNLYYSKSGGVEWYNPGFYNNPVVDKYLDQALAAPSEQAALTYWKKAQWDGKTGFSARGDAPWAWMVNINHLYLVREGLDIGKQKIQVHGHGWPVTDNIAQWKWTAAADKE